MVLLLLSVWWSTVAALSLVAWFVLCVLEKLQMMDKDACGMGRNWW
jgi:hypothetical protein